MAKIIKIKKGAETGYPLSIFDAIRSSRNGESLVNLLSKNKVFSEGGKSNLYDKAANVQNSLIDLENGSINFSGGGARSGTIFIEENKSYKIKGFTGDTSKSKIYSRTLIFRDATGNLIPNTSYGWSSSYSMADNVNDITFKYSEYVLVPEAILEPNWRTNGGNRLPIPFGASQVIFNTISGPNLIDYSDTLEFFEFDADFKAFPDLPYLKYSESELSVLLGLSKVFLSKITKRKTLTPPPLIIPVTAVFDKYINGVSGGIEDIAPVGGLVYAVSEPINIVGSEFVFINGRQSQDVTNVTKTAIVFYDASGNKLKPLNELGFSYPTFTPPNENGAYYVPSGAVTMRFNALFKSDVSILQNIKVTPDGLNYVDLGDENYDFAEFVRVNSAINDGEVMVKKGGTYMGIPIEELASHEDQYNYDGIFKIINFLASAISRVQSLEIVPVNMVPEGGNPTIFYKDGELLFTKEGVVKKIQLIDL